jgi:hypothetical protein
MTCYDVLTTPTRFQAAASWAARLTDFIRRSGEAAATMAGAPRLSLRAAAPTAQRRRSPVQSSPLHPLPLPRPRRVDSSKSPVRPSTSRHGLAGVAFPRSGLRGGGGRPRARSAADAGFPPPPVERNFLRLHETERPVRTASVNQVRHPIYRSSAGRWRKHAMHLLPLLEALGLSSP